MSTAPPPYGPPPPSREFPWVACAIIGGLAAVFLFVAAIAAVGYLIFLKPTSKPSTMTPQQMQQMMQNTAPPGAQPGAPPTAAVSADEAIAKVKALPEVAEWIANVTKAGGSPHIDMDSEDAVAYTVHVYEVVKEEGDIPSHTATMGWFTVDKGTGEVKQQVP
jgi:hypothetical protein